MAKVSFYSPWYSYRIFTEITGITPSDYIRRLKLSKSALSLRDEKVRILDIAIDYGYESADGYQRAFYKEFGINPFEYSKNPTPICLFIPYKKYNSKEQKMENFQNIFISIVNKPKRKVLIKRGTAATNYMEYCSEVGCGVWRILSSIKSPSGEPVCMWLPMQYVPEGTSTYVQGVELDDAYTLKIPDGFEIITLPEATYLMFCGEPFAEEDYEAAISSLWSAMEKFNPISLGYEWDEANPRIQLEPRGKRGYIELRPVVKV